MEDQAGEHARAAEGQAQIGLDDMLRVLAMRDAAFAGRFRERLDTVTALLTAARVPAG